MRVKICGLTAPGPVRHAAASGAAYVGLVFFPPSPRNVPPEHASALIAAAPAGVTTVALLVDPEEALVGCCRSA